MRLRNKRPHGFNLPGGAYLGAGEVVELDDQHAENPGLKAWISAGWIEVEGAVRDPEPKPEPLPEPEPEKAPEPPRRGKGSSR